MGIQDAQERSPKRVEDVKLHRLGDETILHDTSRKRVHVLNKVTRLIWDQCDGKTSVHAIVEKVIAEHADAPAESVKQDVVEILEQLRREHLVD